MRALAGAVLVRVILPNELAPRLAVLAGNSINNVGAQPLVQILASSPLSAAAPAGAGATVRGLGFTK